MTSFVETGGRLSVLVEGDQYHEARIGHWMALIDLDAKLVTTNFIFDEVLTRLRYDVGHPKALEFLDLVHAAEAEGDLRVEHVDANLWSEAEAIFRRYADARLSFTDCTSFVLATKLNR
ncbi:MAG: putative nucleic acid-binding protein contains domain [Planctomycetota bacterium]|nr:putative nucleic acid-binding protein contains domain [Planctomycetota bacterium]